MGAKSLKAFSPYEPTDPDLSKKWLERRRSSLKSISLTLIREKGVLTFPSECGGVKVDWAARLGLTEGVLSSLFA